MNAAAMYQERKISMEEALSKINSGDEVVVAMAAAEPVGFVSRLHEVADRVRQVTVVTCLPMGGYEYFKNPDYRESFHMDGWFYSPEIRRSHQHRNVSFIPNHLHLAATKRLHYRKPDLFVGTASPMDRHGYLSLSLSATYEREIMENSRLSIVEINENLPRTFGDTIVHISQIDHVVEHTGSVPALSVIEPTPLDQQIGGYVADLVEDGATIQLGIGGIPNAVALALKTKKDLGIHTEMLTDSMVELYKCGAVTNAQKTLMPGKMVAAFALGSQGLYDFIDENPGVQIMRGRWVNDPFVIGQNHRMVSINTTIEIDLTGQCCSESIGHRQFSGTGGQADTAIGAQLSQGGKAIIALYSTAQVRQPSTGEKQRVSKIVSQLTPGAAVTLSRNDVDYVVTEYGVASLRGTPVRERVKRLIAIAHPDFRDSLTEEARHWQIW